jgi:hypothetical protein
MTSIDVVTDKKTFEYGIPKRLFSIPIPSNAATGGGDVSGDGKQFWFVAPQAAAGPPQPFTVVLNWQAALKK